MTRTRTPLRKSANSNRVLSCKLISVLVPARVRSGSKNSASIEMLSLGKVAEFVIYSSIDAVESGVKI